MIKNIRWPVYLVALALTLLPTLGAFYAVRGILDSATTIGINRGVTEELDRAGTRLKELAKFDPSHEEKYRTEFEKLQETRRNYGLLVDLAPALNTSYMEVFLIILGVALAMALGLAWWLNRKIIGSHEAAVSGMKVAQERNAYLENREAWRLVAQKFVHEVKNPLTPVKVMVGRLLSKYKSTHGEPSPEFEAVLQETRDMVSEETDKITRWVEAFSNYARMPDAALRNEDLRRVLEDFLRQYGDYWENLKIQWTATLGYGNWVHCDSVLFKQVLFNIAKNSSEASVGSSLTLSISCEQVDGGYRLILKDNGPGLRPDLPMKLFQPYAGSKANAGGMGLGLAISKKIMLEHGGDIRFLPSNCGCGFELMLRRGEYHESK